MSWFRLLLISSLTLLTACGGGGGDGDSTPSSNANLSSLLVEDGVLSPVFSSATTSYAADVAGGTTSTRITAFVSNSRARLTIDGVATSTGTASDPIDLIVGNTDVDVVVTAQDGTRKTYRVRIVRPQPGSDANLSSLSLTAGSLEQIFDPARTSYNITVGHLALSTRVLSTPNDPLVDSISVDGTLTTIGKPSQLVPLNEGIDATSIDVEVIAEDDATRKTYTVVATRAAFSTVTQDAYVKANNSDAEDRFGTAIALTGDRLLTGAPDEQSRASGVDGNENDNSGAAVGAAYLYERIGGVWMTGHYLKSSNADDGDRFGRSLASTENVLAVGAPGEQSLSGNQSDNSGATVGAVYVFDADAAGAPIQSDYLKASNPDDGDAFGGAIAVDGDRVLIGARFEASNASGVNGDEADNSLSNAGAAYLFEANGGGAYTQTAYLKASNPTSGTDNQFANAVALSGSTLAIGAWYEDGGATGINGDQTDTSQPRSGAVYIFDQADDGSWSQTAYIKASNPGQEHHFGASLAIDGARLIVGAPGENTTEQNSGAVYVFVRDGTNSWTQEAMLKPSTIGQNDLFGTHVALVGDLLAAGAPGERSDSTGINEADDNQNAVDSGAVYLFERTGPSLWNQLAFVKASNTDPGDLFGSSLTLDGDTLAVGAPGEQSDAEGIDNDSADNSSNSAGAVYVIQ